MIVKSPWSVIFRTWRRSLKDQQHNSFRYSTTIHSAYWDVHIFLFYQLSEAMFRYASLLIRKMLPRLIPRFIYIFYKITVKKYSKVFKQWWNKMTVLNKMLYAYLKSQFNDSDRNSLSRSFTTRNWDSYHPLKITFDVDSNQNREE